MIHSIESVVKLYFNVPVLDPYSKTVLYFLCRRHTRSKPESIVKYIGIDPDRSLLNSEDFKLDIDTIEQSYLN